MESQSYRWHYDYTRLAWESGFCFDSHKSKKVFDRNAIAVIDIERIIREKDIAVVERHIENILDYNLDHDELRILDPNFVKLFRLGQLSVEFLIYCKKYLDKTVVSLKNELDKKNEENEQMEKEMSKLQTENQRLKKRMKELKTTMYYQQNYHPSIGDQPTVFQCHECGKAFINNEFLNTHLKRRHNIINNDNLSEKNSPEHTINTTPEHEQYKTETDRLQNEIKELKEKLNNAERYFNPNNQTCTSPEHGTIQIKSASSHNDCSNDIKSLRQQFSSLKTQVETELNYLKTQKLEHHMYEQLIQNIFTRIEPPQRSPEKETLHIEKIISERRNSYTQTEDVKIEIATNKSEPVLVESKHSSPAKLMSSPQKRPTIQKVKESSHFIKVVESPTKTEMSNKMQINTNMETVQAEVEKKLEEKTKQEIEQLGEQITAKMSTTFNKLEQRMETFWSKLNEIQTHNRSETPSPTQTEKKVASPSAHSVSRSSSKGTSSENKHLSKTVSKQESPPKEIIEKVSPRVIKSSATESDSISETESNRICPSDTEVPENIEIEQEKSDKSNELLNNMIEELKTKVQEREKSTSSKTSPKETLKHTKFSVQSKSNLEEEPKEVTSEQNIKQQTQRTKQQIKPVAQIPVVKKVFSQPLKHTTSESETESSESESESSSEEDIKPVKVVAKNKTSTEKLVAIQPQKSQERKVAKSLENKLAASSGSLGHAREEVEEAFSSRLRDFGVDPQWKTLPTKAYKQKSELAAHQRTLTMKKNKSLSNIREGILEELEYKVKQLRKPSQQEPEAEEQQKTSKFKSLISTMKTKAKLLIKTDRTPTKSVPKLPSPLYRLTVKQNLSEEEELKVITPTKMRKEKPPVKKGKIIIKPKKMYESDDSNSENSSNIKRKQKNIEVVSIGSRRSKSATSLDTDFSEKSLKTRSMQNIAQSISNLDSILELKKEISAQISQEISQRNIKPANRLSDESFTEEISKKPQQKSVLSLPSQKTVVVEHVDDEYSDLDSKSEHKVQKSSFKNHPSSTKKKVLFDLESESIKTVSVPNVQPDKKSFVKPSSFFDEDDTSATSSVFDGSKTNLNKSSREKISTKAIINVPTKNKNGESESDWDVSEVTKAVTKVPSKHKNGDIESDWDISDIIN